MGLQQIIKIPNWHFQRFLDNGRSHKFTILNKLTEVKIEVGKQKYPFVLGIEL